MPVESSQPSKRSCVSGDGGGSSDAHCFGDLNLSDDEQPEVPAPIGRDRARKVAHNPGSSSSRGTMLSDELVEKLSSNLELCAGSFKDQLEVERMKVEDAKFAREEAMLAREAARFAREEAEKRYETDLRGYDAE